MSDDLTRMLGAATVAALLALSVSLLAGCGGGEEAAAPTEDAAPAEDAAPVADGTEEGSAEGDASGGAAEGADTGPTGEETGEVTFHESDVEVSGDEIAVITTPKGVIEFEFFEEAAPNHVASFIELADSGYYDGTRFHRVEPGFVIQGGDPLSKTNDPAVGTGGPGYYLRQEFNDKPHLDGTVSMARATDPDSAGSQFFICLGPQSFLDGQYTAFGQVTSGLDVVHSIEKGDVMESVEIRRSE